MNSKITRVIREIQQITNSKRSQPKLAEPLVEKPDLFSRLPDECIMLIIEHSPMSYLMFIFIFLNERCKRINNPLRYDGHKQYESLNYRLMCNIHAHIINIIRFGYVNVIKWIGSLEYLKSRNWIYSGH